MMNRYADTALRRTASMAQRRNFVVPLHRYDITSLRLPREADPAAVLLPVQPVSTYVRPLIGLRTHVLTHAHTLTDVRTYGIMVL